MFYIDSADPKEIAWAFSLGLVRGVTTNPLQLKEQPGTWEEKIKLICEAVPRHAGPHGHPVPPISVPLPSSSPSAMLKAVDLYRSWDDRIVMKIPITEMSLGFMHTLREPERAQKYILTNLTAVMSFGQAYAGVLAGARFVSLICGRMKDAGVSDSEVVKQLTQRIRHQQLKTTVIAASLRTPADVNRVLTAGAHVATVTGAVLRKVLRHELTDQMIREFQGSLSDV
jgi:transaldolase